MNGKQIVFLIGCVAIGLFLAACGVAPTPKVDDAAATKIVATFMAQITQTAAAAEDFPTATESAESPAGTMIELPEDDETPEPAATPESYKALLDKFRTVTVSNGNLFVRDGTELPVQITKSGTDHDPVISADGQKIVFYRGEEFGEVFVVNADGSDEKSIINNKALPELGKSDVKFLTFRLGTHDLLFNTTFCSNPLSFCTIGIFLFHAESATFTKFAGGLSGSKYQRINFFESPNGQYLSIADFDHLDLFSMDGKVIHPDIVTGSAKTDWLAEAYWLPDSSGLVAIMSTAIWRYSLKTNRAEQLLFAPQPVMLADAACQFLVSPDRAWILYQNDGYSYLGNLQNAKAQTDNWSGDCHVQWSPDSQHFASQTAIGSVDGTPPIKLDGHFIAWLDATHYLYTKGKNMLDLQSYIAEVGKEAAAVQTNFTWSPVYAVLP